ncbi:MAG: ATP-dependent Clp protease ATP-binding subunit ClpC [Actinomycetota bacterium]|jgi:ATP-dependent Clp protease ATP-binding subunit ClpA/DNA-binding CsgD family transcriptional regulator|nr:ATP-dependent Clp protease ATP-binding subunit ClpC [Actinomycetota bacterium]
MFERFTDRARRVLVLAQEEARLLNHPFIGTEHILLGLMGEGEGVAAKALGSLGVSLDQLRVEVERTIAPGTTEVVGAPPFTPRSKKVLELSLREALRLGHNYIGTEHMLLGLVREAEGVAAEILLAKVGDLSRVRDAVIEILGHYGKPKAKEGDDQPTVGLAPFTPAGSNAIHRATQFSQGRASSLDLLIALASDGSSRAGKLLAAKGLSVEAIDALKAEVGVEGTTDETAEQALGRQIHLEYDSRGVTIRIEDPQVTQQVQELMQADAGGVSGHPDLAPIVRIVVSVIQSLVDANPDHSYEPDPPVSREEAINLLQGVAEARIEAAAAQTPKPELTAHETEVLEGLAAGISIEDVAGAMGVSVEQAESMARNVRAKLDIQRRLTEAQHLIDEETPPTDD